MALPAMIDMQSEGEACHQCVNADWSAGATIAGGTVTVEGYGSQSKTAQLTCDCPGGSTCDAMLTPKEDSCHYAVGSASTQEWALPATSEVQSEGETEQSSSPVAALVAALAPAMHAHMGAAEKWYNCPSDPFSPPASTCPCQTMQRVTLIRVECMHQATVI